MYDIQCVNELNGVNEYIFGLLLFMCSYVEVKKD